MSFQKKSKPGEKKDKRTGVDLIETATGYQVTQKGLTKH